MNKNHVQLIGYVGQDLAAVTAVNGSRRVAIRMATHYRKRTQTDEKIDTTVWHNIVAWDSTAEYAERSFVKGSKILVEGSIDYRTFTGKNGNTVHLTQIRAHSLMNLDR